MIILYKYIGGLLPILISIKIPRTPDKCYIYIYIILGIIQNGNCIIFNCNFGVKLSNTLDTDITDRQH